MVKVLNRRFFFAQMLLLVLVAIIVAMPNAKILSVTYYPLLVALGVMDLLYLLLLISRAKRGAERHHRVRLGAHRSLGACFHQASPYA